MSRVHSEERKFPLSRGLCEDIHSEQLRAQRDRMRLPPKLEVRKWVGNEASDLDLGSGAMPRCLNLSCQGWKAASGF